MERRKGKKEVEGERERKGMEKGEGGRGWGIGRSKEDGGKRKGNWERGRGEA